MKSTICICSICPLEYTTTHTSTLLHLVSLLLSHSPILSRVFAWLSWWHMFSSHLSQLQASPHAESLLLWMLRCHGEQLAITIALPLRAGDIKTALLPTAQGLVHTMVILGRNQCMALCVRCLVEFRHQLVLICRAPAEWNQSQGCVCVQCKCYYKDMLIISNCCLCSIWTGTLCLWPYDTAVQTN